MTPRPETPLPETPHPDTVTPPRKRSMQERLTQLIEEYGKVAFAVWAVIAVLVFGGSALALHLGMDIEGAKGAAGTFAGAYLVYQVSKPLRWAAVVALTPLIARLLRRGPHSPSTP